MLMWEILWLYILSVSLFTFALYGNDKRRAEKKRYRIPERQLLFWAGIGGSPGAFLGMLFFHHKTRKMKFRVLVPLFLVLHAGILTYIYIYILNRNW